VVSRVPSGAQSRVAKSCVLHSPPGKGTECERGGHLIYGVGHFVILEVCAIGQIGHSLIPMGLVVLKNQDLILYGSPGYSGLDSI
jgi:carbonic anhydrase/acetyltransferase-like protein (isoleucine patch superfamily)